MDSIKKIFNDQIEYSWRRRAESIENRIADLKRLKNLILKSEKEIIEAHLQDFRKPEFETLMTEIYPVITEINLTLKNLKKWTRPKKVSSGLLLLGSKSEIQYHPKGTVLIIGPSNYPFSLTVVPLVSALAAGNTVILKPSELTPNVSSTIKKILNQAFASNLIEVVEGGKDQSENLLKLSFAHIFFTGSTQIGKIVYSSAAQNLTPVTLELGGKSPTIIDHSADLEDAAQKILWGKLLNSGQTCVSPDYIFIPSELKESFLRHYAFHAKKILQEHQPPLMIAQRHFERQQNLIAEAHTSNLKTHSFSNSTTPREVLPSLVEIDFKKQTDLKLMQEEIFGPTLPLLTYEDVNDCISYIKKHDHPLALYIFSKNQNFIDKILSQTISGGVCINDVILHVGNHNLPFGGVGASGIGSYHGHAGFRTFSHERAVLKQSWGSFLLKRFYPPYKSLHSKLIRLLIR